MNEPGAIPYFEARESLFASRLEQSCGFFDRGRVGRVAHQLDGADVPMAHKIAAHDSLPSEFRRECARPVICRLLACLSAVSAQTSRADDP